MDVDIKVNYYCHDVKLGKREYITPKKEVKVEDEVNNNKEEYDQ